MPHIYTYEELQQLPIYSESRQVADSFLDRGGLILISDENVIAKENEQNRGPNQILQAYYSPIINHINIREEANRAFIRGHELGHVVDVWAGKCFGSRFSDLMSPDTYTQLEEIILATRGPETTLIRVNEGPKELYAEVYAFFFLHILDKEEHYGIYKSYSTATQLYLEGC
jgi:hypothetical protein